MENNLTSDEYWAISDRFTSPCGYMESHEAFTEAVHAAVMAKNDPGWVAQRDNAAEQGRAR